MNSTNIKIALIQEIFMSKMIFYLWKTLLEKSQDLGFFNLTTKYLQAIHFKNDLGFLLHIIKNSLKSQIKFLINI